MVAGEELVGGDVDLERLPHLLEEFVARPEAVTVSHFDQRCTPVEEPELIGEHGRPPPERGFTVEEGVVQIEKRQAAG